MVADRAGDITGAMVKLARGALVDSRKERYMNKSLDKMQFSIVIDASREKVWRTMLEPEGYKAWTAQFAEGSYFEGSWDKGARIKFLTPGGEGMTSMIVDNKPYEFISIKHLGIIKDGVEDTQTVESKSWAEAYENYTFYERNGLSRARQSLDNPK